MAMQHANASEEFDVCLVCHQLLNFYTAYFDLLWVLCAHSGRHNNFYQRTLGISWWQFNGFHHTLHCALSTLFTLFTVHCSLFTVCTRYSPGKFCSCMNLGFCYMYIYIYIYLCMFFISISFFVYIYIYTCIDIYVYFHIQETNT